MNKIWVIASRDIYTALADRSLMLIMFVTPLAISTIIALAFSNISGGGAPLRDIPVALVNLDEGIDGGFASGSIFTSLLVADAGDIISDSDMPICGETVRSDDTDMDFTLLELTNTTLVDSAEEARQAVDRGLYAVAIIIPPDFSQSITYSQSKRTLNAVSVEVYGDPARPISVSVMGSITEGIVNQIMTGQITVASTIETMIARAQSDPVFGLNFLALNASGAFDPDFSCAFTPVLNPISIDRQQVGVAHQNGEFNLLVIFGSALALFFALFTANGGATTILEENKNWTLQRLLITPTSRFQIMLGKLIGIFVLVLIQLIFLLFALTLINTMLTGAFRMIWGDNLLLTFVLLIAGALSASGVGMITAATATSMEQANIIGSIVAMFMGITGGAFFQLPPSPIVDFISSFSIVHWGSEAFTMLSQGQSDVGVHVVILLGIGALFFGVSLIIFNRRQDLGA